MAKKKEKNEAEIKLKIFFSSKKGKGLRRCVRCGTTKGVIRKYGLNICRRCLREIGESLGFYKYQ